MNYVNNNRRNLRTRTPQGDGNVGITTDYTIIVISFKNQNPARGRKLVNTVPMKDCTTI